MEEVTAENTGESIIFYSVSFQAPELIISRIGSCVFKQMVELEEVFGADLSTRPELIAQYRGGGGGKRCQVPFAGTARRVLRTKGT
jgi:hypothetical protein